MNFTRSMRDKLEQQIHEFAKHIYTMGYLDGKEVTQAEREQIYNHGLDHAWVCIRDIIGLGEPTEIVEEAGLRNFVCKYSAQEAIDILKAYKERQQDLAEEQEWGTWEERLGKEEFTGCDVCKYEDKDMDEEPCKSCSHCYTDKFQHKE